jgi:hypothetical protein
VNWVIGIVMFAAMSSESDTFFGIAKTLFETYKILCH